MIGEGTYDWLENSSGAIRHLTGRFGLKPKTAREIVTEKCVDRPYFGRGYAVWITDRKETRLFGPDANGMFDLKEVDVHWVHVADLEPGDLGAEMKPLLLQYMEAS